MRIDKFTFQTDFLFYKKHTRCTLNLRSLDYSSAERQKQKNPKFFWHQSEARTAATVWNWSGKTLSPGALLAVLYFSLCHIFPPV